MDLMQLAEKVSLVARGAGELIINAVHPDVYTKEGRTNFVTSMDLASQEYIIARLRDILPEANFFAEESDSNEMLPGYNWIIDPIDGTMNYMIGYKHSCISIALVKDGESILGVIYDPYLDEMYIGAKGCGAYLNGKRIYNKTGRATENCIVLFGTAMYYRELAELSFNVARKVFDLCGDIRRTGSAALDLCYVACGKCDAYFEILLQPWDFSAGTIIAREAGAVVSNILGKPLDFSKPCGILAGNPDLREKIERIVTEQAELLHFE